MDLRSGNTTRTPTSGKRTHTERNSPDFHQGLPKKSVMESVSDEDKATLRSQNIPDWGLSLLEILNKTLTESVSKSVTASVEESFKKELNSELSKFDTKIQDSIDEKCNLVKTECMAKIESLSSKVDLAVLNAEASKAYVKKVDTRLTDKVVKLEDYSRRKNLLFSGLKESKNEKQSDCLKLVKGELGKIKHENGKPMSKCIIERCHRVGKPKPDQSRPRDILCRFLSWDDRQTVSSGRSKLSKDVFVKADHAPEIANANRALKPILKVIQGTPYAAKGRVVVRDGCIYVDNKKFTIRNLYSLPKGINFYQGNHVSTQSSLAFFGILSPYSNFHWSPFTIEDVNYVCSEQFITASLAKLFDEEDVYVEVMTTCDPYFMKKLAYRVKDSDDYDALEWEAKIPDIAYAATSAKFTQNTYFGQCLIDTEDKLLAEASTETPWGCGMKLDNENLKDVKKWKSVGVMGEMLMRVRDELRLERGLPKLKPIAIGQAESPHASNASDSDGNASMESAEGS